MRLSAHGITTELPAGWEGRITRRRRQAPVGRVRRHRPTAAARAGAIGSPDEIPEPVVHLANFALPEDRGDFGSGAVDVMGSGHVLREPVRVRPRERRPGALREPGHPDAPPEDVRAVGPAEDHHRPGRLPALLHPQRPGLLPLRRARQAGGGGRPRPQGERRAARHDDRPEVSPPR